MNRTHSLTPGDFRRIPVEEEFTKLVDFFFGMDPKKRRHERRVSRGLDLFFITPGSRSFLLGSENKDHQKGRFKQIFR